MPLGKLAGILPQNDSALARLSSRPLPTNLTRSSISPSLRRTAWPATGREQLSAQVRQALVDRAAQACRRRQLALDAAREAHLVQRDRQLRVEIVRRSQCRRGHGHQHGRRGSAYASERHGGHLGLWKAARAEAVGLVGHEVLLQGVEGHLRLNHWLGDEIPSARTYPPFDASRRPFPLQSRVCGQDCAAQRDKMDRQRRA